MKFTCEQSGLMSALLTVAKAASDKTPMESLAAVRMRTIGQEVELTGYDLELGIRTCIPADVEEDGDLLADGRLFSEIVRKMPAGTLTLSANEKLHITVSVGETECRLSGRPSDEYPDLPDIEEQNSAVIQQKLLKNMIEQTVYAVSTDETKPVFTGELIEIQDNVLSIAALDNFRLAVRTEPVTEQKDMSFIVPAKALREISHMLTEDEKEEHLCTIRLDQNHALFEIGTYVVYTRLLAGKFVNYRNSIPMNPKTEVLVSRSRLCGSLDRCALLITEKAKAPVRIQFEPNLIQISCVNLLGSADDQIECSLTGDTMTVGFNCRYLLDAVNAVQGDMVRICLTAPDRAVKIMEAEGDNSVAVVMPVQVRR